MEDNNQVADAGSSEEVIELEIQPDEDVDTLRAQLAAAQEKSRQILARAHAAESRLKSAKPAAAAHQGADDEYTELRLDGYSKEDAKFIVGNGGRKSLEDANSLVAIAIKAKREQANAEAQAAKVGGSAPTSEVERRFTQAELNAMSVAELQKILPKAD